MPKLKHLKAHFTPEDWAKELATRNAYRKKYYARSENMRKRAVERARQWAKANPERNRELKRNAQRKYRQKVVEMKAGRARPTTCDLCLEECHRIYFDHSHVYGHFRGWLCRRCNTVLGAVRDDPEILRSMVAYLDKWEKPLGKTEMGQGQPSRGEIRESLEAHA